MISIIETPIHKIEYSKEYNATLIYVESKKYFYLNRYGNAIIVGEIKPDGSIGERAIPLRKWKELQLYKDCFLLLNNRGGLIYA